MTIQEITDFLDKKIEEDESKVVIKFYEVRMKMNLSQEETDIFLNYCKIRLENLGYSVFVTGQEYMYYNIQNTVQDNELMVGIKNN